MRVSPCHVIYKYRNVYARKKHINAAYVTKFDVGERKKITALWNSTVQDDFLAVLMILLYGHIEELVVTHCVDHILDPTTGSFPYKTNEVLPEDPDLVRMPPHPQRDEHQLTRP